jgi:hypothetical protein
VHGASDRLGAYPDEDPVLPEELHATIYHCLGVPPTTQILDRQSQPHALCTTGPITPLLI